MSTHPRPPTDLHAHALRFRSLFDDGRGYTFPCDDRGQVALDNLSPRERLSYLYARTLIGREFGVPVVELQAA